MGTGQRDKGGDLVGEGPTQGGCDDFSLVPIDGVKQKKKEKMNSIDMTSYKSAYIHNCPLEPFSYDYGPASQIT